MMDEKDSKKLTGWVDYDRPYLNSLTKSQQIKYFHKRLKMVLLLPLKELYESLMKRKKRSSTVLCMSNCICCSIEALGKFYTGKIKSGFSGNNFKKFVEDYMNSNFKSKIFKEKKYVDILWKDFRNGLAHGFTIKDGGFEHNTSYFQIKKICGKEQLEIDPTHFYEDFINAVNKYINDLRCSKKKDTLYNNFEKTFVNVFIQGK